MIRILLFVLFSINYIILFSQSSDFSTFQIAQSESQGFYPELRMRSTASNFDVTHQRIQIKIDPNKRFISGQVTTSFKVLDNPIRRIDLDLNSDLTVINVTTFSGRALNFTQNDDDTFTVIFDNPISDTSSVRINYEGIPPEDGLGSFRQEVHGTGPIVWTLSEPYGALDWWPCHQNLSDKIDSLDFLIEVPHGYQAASNGLLVDNYRIAETNSRVFHWRHNYPITTYLVAFAVSNYQVHEQTIKLKDGTLPVMNYLYPQDYENNVKILERDLSPMMQLFDSLFVGYPFKEEKYGHAQFGFGGGMEHQTISFMVNFNYGLMAHELAHHWFGDYITCGSWEDIWLNEGFATYLTGLTYEHLIKNGTWENFLDSKIQNITSQTGGSVKVSDTTSVSRIFNSRLSYNKGAMLLHMLRWKLGDTNFFKGINNYLMDPELKYSYSRTEDLKYHLQSTSGKDLSDFFEDWYEGQGYPSYHIQWNQDGKMTNINLSQTTSHPSVDFFEMPVPIKLYGPSSDTIIVLEHSHNDQNFSFQVPFKINRIVFDPDRWIVSKDNTIDILSSTDRETNVNVTIFPNPSSDHLNIKISNQSIKQYSIVNVLGKRMVTKSIPDSQSFKIPLSPFNQGIYFLQLRLVNNSVLIKKFIKTQ